MIPNFQPELDEYKYILFNTKEGLPGREYLKKRNISPQTAKIWNLGYCPKDYDANCYKSFLKENITYFWRRMNNRLIIPIYNSNNKLISLSGREINSKWPKYIHYPFQVKQNLFGLNINKDNIRTEDYALVTEGQIDVISAWQKGIKNITSSFGAHSSQYHLALLARYTNNIYYIYDNDEAGLQSIKFLKRIKHADLNVKYYINVFNKNEDLDNFCQNHTKAELETLLNKSKYME